MKDMLSEVVRDTILFPIFYDLHIFRSLDSIRML